MLNKTFFIALMMLVSWTVPAASDIKLAPAQSEYSIHGKKDQLIEFTIDKKLPQNVFINLQFDGFLKHRSYGGYDCCLQIFCNGKPVSGKDLINVPPMFLRNNGASSMAASWGYGYQKNIDMLYLLYAPSLAAAQSDQCPYRPQTWNGTTYRYNITQYLKPGKNTIRFFNNQQPHVHRLLSSQTPIPAMISSVRVFASTQKPLPQEEWWITELKELNRQVRTVEPRKNKAEKYSFKALNNGRVEISSGDARYYLDSFYSFPRGGYNAIGNAHAEKSEKEFKVTIIGQGSNTVMTARGKYYMIERKFALNNNFITVRDTFTSLVDQPIGVITQYELTTDKRNQNPVMVCGVPVKSTSAMTSPENPSVFLPGGSGGCGIIPNNDILQVHCRSYADKNVCGISDPALVLQGKSKVTLEFDIYPVARGDMFTFVNNVRDNWQLNGINSKKGKHFIINMVSEIPGRMAKWKPHESRMDSIWVGHFASWSNTTPKRAIWKWGWAVLQDKKMCQERKELVAELRKRYLLAQKLPIFYCVMAPYGSNDPQRRDDELFKDWIMVNHAGMKLSEAGYHYFIPTLDNEFGKTMRKLVDTALDDWKCDGIFFDYLEGAKIFYTYNRTDGVSGDIDPRSKRLLRQKACYQLLAKDYTIDLVRYIAVERKKLLVANRSFFTRSTREACKDLIPMRLGEALSLDQIARSYFAPVPNAYQRNYREVHKQFLSALYMGVVPMEYDTLYPTADSPDASMANFAVQELGRGYVLGTNKIATCISGDFSFGDNAQVTVRLYDENGKRMPETFKKVNKNGKLYTQVRLEYGQIAIIDKK